MAKPIQEDTVKPGVRRDRDCPVEDVALDVGHPPNIGCDVAKHETSPTSRVSVCDSWTNLPANREVGQGLYIIAHEGPRCYIIAHDPNIALPGV